MRSGRPGANQYTGAGARSGPSLADRAAAAAAVVDGSLAEEAAWAFSPERTRWAAEGFFSHASAAGWIDKGYEPDQASDWSAYGFDVDAAWLWDGPDFTIVEAANWRSVTEDPGEASEWRRHCGYAVAYSWKNDAGIVDPDRAERWDGEGFSPAEAKMWVAAGIAPSDPETAKDLRRCHVTPGELSAVEDEVDDRESADEWIRALERLGRVVVPPGPRSARRRGRLRRRGRS